MTSTIIMKDHIKSYPIELPRLQPSKIYTNISSNVYLCTSIVESNKNLQKLVQNAPYNSSDKST